MCTFQELRNFKDKTVKYSQLENNKKKKTKEITIQDFIFFVFSYY